MPSARPAPSTTGSAFHLVIQRERGRLLLVVLGGHLGKLSLDRLGERCRAVQAQELAERHHARELAIRALDQNERRVLRPLREQARAGALHRLARRRAKH